MVDSVAGITVRTHTEDFAHGINQEGSLTS